MGKYTLQMTPTLKRTEVEADSFSITTTDPQWVEFVRQDSTASKVVFVVRGEVLQSFMYED